MIDLHIHSRYSDGTNTIDEIVRMAKQKNIKALSLTDHDNINGLDEMKISCEKENIECIAGIEFSTEYYGVEVHILGYFLDTRDNNLLEKLNYLKSEREERTKELLEKLKKYKINLSYEEVKSVATSDIISRSHIALLMLQKGYVYSIKEAFINYIGTGGAAYIPKKDVDTLGIISLLNENKALSFLAHPKFIKVGEGKLLKMIDEFKDMGLDGIETNYSAFTEKYKNYYKNIAKEKKLLISGGSDFHGDIRNNIEIGDGNAYYEMITHMKKQLLYKYGKVVD